MFYKTSKVWILDFTYDGAPRRWFKALLEDADARTLFEAQRGDLYGKRGRFVDVRPATRDEETQYLNGTAPKKRLLPEGPPPIRKSESGIIGRPR